MYAVKKLQNKTILTKNENIGIVADSSLFKTHRNQSTFKSVLIDNKKIIIDKGEETEESINLFDVDFFPLREEITLKSSKNLLKIPFHRTFALKDINNGIAYYYCIAKDVYLIKDIRKNKFIRQKGNKFFTYAEKKGVKKKWYTGSSPEPIIL